MSEDDMKVPEAVHVLHMAMQSQHDRGYILGGPNGKTPVPVPMLDAARYFDKNDDKRRVAMTTIPGGFVSTVFLIFDHSYSRIGPPVLFETMVFGGPEDGLQLRHHTYDEASAGHAFVVYQLRKQYGFWGWHWGRTKTWVAEHLAAIARLYRNRHARDRSDP